MVLEYNHVDFMFLSLSYQISRSLSLPLWILDLYLWALVITSVILFALQDYIFLSDQGGLQIHAYHKNDGSKVKTYTVDATPHHLVIAGQVSDPPTGQCGRTQDLTSRLDLCGINRQLFAKSRILLLSVALLAMITKYGDTISESALLSQALFSCLCG